MSKNTRRKSVFLQWAERITGKQWGCRPEERDAEAIDQAMKRMSWLFGSYFKMEVQGFEQVPERNTLLVSNHSGGMLILDVMGNMTAWHERFGHERPLHVLVHDVLLAMKWPGSFLSKMGALRACPKNAKAALVEHERDLLVYPGGDIDAYRPYSQKHEVQFSGRQGYVRLALQTGVPITPIAHHGAHETLFVLSSGKAIARMLRLEKLFGAKVFPMYLCFPWIFLPGPFLPHFPLPRTFRYKFGAPIEMPEVTWEGAPPQELVDAIDAKVQASIETMMRELDDEASKDRWWHRLLPKPTKTRRELGSSTS